MRRQPLTQFDWLHVAFQRIEDVDERERRQGELSQLEKAIRCGSPMVEQRWSTLLRNLEGLRDFFSDEEVAQTIATTRWIIAGCEGVEVVR